MAILLNFIISQGALSDVNPLSMVHRQSGKYDYLTYTVYNPARLKAASAAQFRHAKAQ